MDNLKDLESMHSAVQEFRKISKHNREVLLNILNKEHEVLGDSVEDPYYQIKRDYLAAGGRNGPAGIIPAIKKVREASGKVPTTGYPTLGLKEAKDLVESW